LAIEVECLSRTEDFATFAVADSRIDDLLVSATLEELVDLFNAEATIDELEDLLTDESAVLDAEDDNPVVVEYLLLEYKSWLLNSSVAVKFDL
jgi:phosphohistidine swiveling domain-containing protein